MENLMHMNLLDIILLAIFSGSVFLGTYRGFIVTTIGICSFFLTLLLTSLLFPLVEEIVKEYIQNPAIVGSISSFVGYILSSFASNWIYYRFKEMVKGYSCGMIDRIFGLWIGAFRGFVICLTAFLVISIVTSSSYFGAKNLWQVFKNIDEKTFPKWLKTSYLFPALRISSSSIYSAVDGTFIESYFTHLELPSIKGGKSDDEVGPQKNSTELKNLLNRQNLQNPDNQNTSTTPPYNQEDLNRQQKSNSLDKETKDYVIESIQNELINESLYSK